MEVSQQLADIELKSNLAKEDIEMLRMEYMLIQDIPEKEKMEILLKLLFSKEEQAIYRKRYIVNSKLIQNNPKCRRDMLSLNFTRVDFKRKHRIDEFEQIALEEKPENISKIMEETLKGVEEENMKGERE